MFIRSPRFAGILVTLLVAGALLFYFRREVGEGAVAGGGDLPAVRGGQIVATLRAEPRSFNWLMVRDYSSGVVNGLLQARLVRINRFSQELEPWLAERWESSSDGLTHTFYLRPGLSWSDGTPFSSADVLFSLQAALDPRVNSAIAGNLVAGGEPIRAHAPDANTVVFTYAGPAGPGVALLDVLTILPRHKLEASLTAGTFADAWGADTPPNEIVGMGPFVLREYQPGQRLVFDRNPNYWRRDADGEQLPYLDRIVVELVPDQNTELLRLTSGAVDLTSSDLRHDDYVTARRAEEEGTIKLVELGVAPDADALWFCLSPEKARTDRRLAFVMRREFRQAISHAVDREEFAQTVFLGEAVPIWGPITPGNERWFTPNIIRYPYDPERARQLLRDIGLEDRDGNGVVEDAAGTEARFTVLTQRGITYYERGLAVVRDYASKVGIVFDVVPLEVGAVTDRFATCDYDAVYMRPLADLDPALNLDLWLSSGVSHVWNMSQKTPATDWERDIDRLMLEQARTLDYDRRYAIFLEAQRIFAENLPVLHFAAPRLFIGHSARLQGVIPSVLRPPVLWNADALSVTAP